MRKYRILTVCILIIGHCVTQSFAQDNFGVNFIFMTWHPKGDKMAFLQPNRLDPEAKIVLNWGGVAHYERFIYKKRWSLKVAQAAYSDCANLFAGHTHLGFRWNFLNGEKHSLRFGFGPTYVYRQSWYQLDGYEQQNQYLKTRGNWQTAFVWYGGEVEYDYTLSEKLSINLHIIPGIPDFFTFGFGFRYWLRPIPANKEWKNKFTKSKWFYSAKSLATSN